MSEIRRMPWGRLVLMLQARAQSYGGDEDEEVREASADEVFAFFGVSPKKG